MFDLRRSIADSRGSSAIEYSLLIALLAFAVLTSIGFMRGGMYLIFNEVEIRTGGGIQGG